MRSKSDIETRVRTLLVTELNKRVQEASKRIPHLCVHNYRHPIDVRKNVAGEKNPQYNRITQQGTHLPIAQTIGLCMLGSESSQTWGGTICEDPIDAQKCPYFKLAVNKKEIWNTFMREVRTPGWLQVNMPEACALIWALELQETPKVPWWRRWLYKIAPLRTEPLRKAENLLLDTEVE